MTVMVFFTSANQGTQEIASIWNCLSKREIKIKSTNYNLRFKDLNGGIVYAIDGLETKHDIDLELEMLIKIMNEKSDNEFVIFYHADDNKWNIFKDKFINYKKIMHSKRYGSGTELWNMIQGFCQEGPENQQSIFNELLEKIREEIARQNLLELRYKLLSPLVAMDLILQFKDENTEKSFPDIENNLGRILYDMQDEYKEINSLFDLLQITNDTSIRSNLEKQFETLVQLNINAKEYHTCLITFADEIGKLVDGY
jgi:hypothetical protein